MSFYKRMKREEAITCFPSIGTVFVSDDKDLWANPFENRSLRARCFFKIIGDKTMEIFFHLTKDEFNKQIKTATFPFKTYFSGAYNTVSICQMRAFGELHLLTESSDIDTFKEGLATDLEKRKNDTKVSSLHEVTTEEKLRALDILLSEGGMFFKFIPSSYAYNVYERG